MNLALLARPAFQMIAQAAEFVFDRFIRRPLQGLMVIAEALALFLPDLAEATVASVVQAISAQLSPTGRSRVAQGFQQLVRGLKLLAWPTGLGVILLVCQPPAIFWLLTVAAVLLICIGWSTLTVSVITVL